MNYPRIIRTGAIVTAIENRLGPLRCALRFFFFFWGGRRDFVEIYSGERYYNYLRARFMDSRLSRSPFLFGNTACSICRYFVFPGNSTRVCVHTIERRRKNFGPTNVLRSTGNVVMTDRHRRFSKYLRFVRSTKQRPSPQSNANQ